MARKRIGSKHGVSGEPDQPVAAKLPQLPEMPASPASKIPAPLQFPSLIAMSMVMSFFLYASASPYTSGDLSTVSAHRDQWWEVAGLLGWRATELGVGWWGEYDTMDQCALTFLTHLPYLYFLTSFYKIRPTTAIFCLSIDLTATCVPFYLLRGSLASHKLKVPKGAVANRSVVNDIGVQVFTSLFATGVYGVVVFGNFGTWMPSYLVTHFEGIKDISSLYNSTFLWLCAAFIPTGIAAKTFLFTPAIAAKPDAYDEKATSFDPETASLMETIEYNLWGHSKRVRTLMKRTATLAVIVGLHTWLHTYVAVDGAEGFGAAGWSSIWALAATLSGLGFWWVGNVDGMSN
ncbi:MAG: hypothetical protein Q9217_003817 [Psora testacea]